MYEDKINQKRAVLKISSSPLKMFLEWHKKSYSAIMLEIVHFQVEILYSRRPEQIAVYMTEYIDSSLFILPSSKYRYVVRMMIIVPPTEPRISNGNSPGLAGVRWRMVSIWSRCRHGCNDARSIQVVGKVRRLWWAHNQRFLGLEEGHSHLLARLGSENIKELH